MSQATVRLAINFSPQAAELLARGDVEVDLFKCPPWPDLIEEAERQRPVFVHFDHHTRPEPSRNSELDETDRFLERTATRYVNSHLSPRAQDLAKGCREERLARARRLATAALRPLVERFGGGQVMLENVPWERLPGFEIDRLATEPVLVREVIEAVDCRLLLDLAHARLTAEETDQDVRELVAAHPVERLAELHVTGLGHDADGRRRDHMPMTEDDWALLRWALEKIADGRWGRPWAVAFEYGGVGPLFEWRSDIDVLRRQLRRLAALLSELGLRP